MNWLTMLGRFRGETKLVDLAEEIASRSRSAVWQRVSGRAPLMEAAEARGYIRARAARIVHREVDVAVQQRHKEVTPAMRPRLIQMATEAVLRLVTIEVEMVAPAAAVRERAA